MHTRAGNTDSVAPALLVLVCLAASSCAGYASRPLTDQAKHDGHNPTPASSGSKDESPSLFPIHKGGKIGFIDNTGKLVVPPIFEDSYLVAGGAFSEGMALITVDVDGKKKYGYIDRTGKVAIPAQYDDANKFSEGLAAVGRDGRHGFIDKAGTEVLPLQYTSASSFSEGLAGICTGMGCGFIDKAGTLIIQPRFQGVGEFSEGLSHVFMDHLKGVYIDRTGSIVFEQSISSGYYNFSNGRLLISINGKHGFIDTTGRLIVKPIYKSAYPFADGMARVMVGDRTRYKFGFIDRDGKLVIKPKYSDAQDFSQGLAAVEINGRYGYIDKAGRVVIRPRFDGAGEFIDGIAPVMTGAVYADVPQTKAKNGYIDKTGKYVWPPSQ